MKYIGSYDRTDDVLEKLEELFKQGISKDRLQIVSSERLYFEDDPNLFRIDEYDQSFYDVPSSFVVNEYKAQIDAGKTLIFELDPDDVKREEATGKISCAVIRPDDSPIDSCYFRNNVLPGDDCVDISDD